MTNQTVAATHQENHVAGILWMLLTMFLFVSMDTMVKYLSADFPVAQIVWARFFFHMLWLAVFLRAALRTIAFSGNIKLQLLRSAMLLMTTTLFFTGLRSTDLSTATSIMFLSPIFVTLLAVPLLGEVVGMRRVAGVLVGFLGALIIIHPQAGVDAAGQSALNGNGESIGSWMPDTGHLLLISAAFCNALYQLLTRRLSAVDSPLTTLFYSGLIGSVATSLWVPAVWQAPSINSWILMVCVGLAGCLSHFCLIRAFRHAPASLVVPFSYSSLLWATLLGFAVFGALPDGWTLVGASLIVSSGLYIFYREKQLSRKVAAASQD